MGQSVSINPIGYNTPAEESGDIRMVRISDIQNDEVQWETVPYCHINKNEADYTSRHCTAVETLCNKVWTDPEGRISAFIPASLRQEFSGKVQRYLPACGFNGT